MWFAKQWIKLVCHQIWFLWTAEVIFEIWRALNRLWEYNFKVQQNWSFFYDVLFIGQIISDRMHKFVCLLNICCKTADSDSRYLATWLGALTITITTLRCKKLYQCAIHSEHANPTLNQTYKKFSWKRCMSSMWLSAGFCRRWPYKK